MSENLKKIIGKSFIDIAESIENKEFGKKIKVGLSTLGGEHGPDEIIKGAILAKEEMKSTEIVLIGKGHPDFKSFETDCESDMHEIMENLLEEGKIDACVTRHYNFPIGVSTVGKVVTPGLGKEMFLATTTGTASPNREQAMFKNAIYGIIAAKAMGKRDPSVGILNLDSARKVKRALESLKENGYDINFGESMRSDGGSIMRGNDLIAATSDIMVLDTLTGNIMMKLFSSYTTGGSFEALGSGYGPGIGFDYDKNILILSRASGAPVVKGAIKYASKLAENDLNKHIKNEYKKIKEAGYKDILESLEPSKKEVDEEITAPEKEIVTESISGIDVLDLEVACQTLWKKDIYAETGMGCTGPIISVNEKNIEKAKEILENNDYI